MTPITHRAPPLVSWVLLLPLSGLFFLLAMALRMHEMAPGWQKLILSAPQQWLLVGNNLVLGLSCLVLHLYWRGVGPRGLLYAAAMLAIGFLLGQGGLWLSLSSQGIYLAATPASSYFYLVSGLHALHLAGGLVAWYLLLRRQAGIGSCVIYWHFLLVVWLLMCLQLF